MKKWNILHEVKSKNAKLKGDDVVDILLENRGIKTKKPKKGHYIIDIAPLQQTVENVDSQYTTPHSAEVGDYTEEICCLLSPCRGSCCPFITICISRDVFYLTASKLSLDISPTSQN